jgi:hypothetical protein
MHKQCSHVHVHEGNFFFRTGVRVGGVLADVAEGVERWSWREVAIFQAVGHCDLCLG